MTEVKLVDELHEARRELAVVLNWLFVGAPVKDKVVAAEDRLLSVLLRMGR